MVLNFPVRTMVASASFIAMTAGSLCLTAPAYATDKEPSKDPSALTDGTFDDTPTQEELDNSEIKDEVVVDAPKVAKAKDARLNTTIKPLKAKKDPKNASRESLELSRAAAAQCSDFSTWELAQRYFELAGGSATVKVGKFDPDSDGLACELKPGFDPSHVVGSFADKIYNGNLNCQELNALGVFNIQRRSLAYRAELDPDNDGVACELRDALPQDPDDDVTPIIVPLKPEDSIDKNCMDFKSQDEAQKYFISQGGSREKNVDRLDGSPSNGLACDSYNYGAADDGTLPGTGGPALLLGLGGLALVGAGGGLVASGRHKKEKGSRIAAS